MKQKQVKAAPKPAAKQTKATKKSPKKVEVVQEIKEEIKQEIKQEVVEKEVAVAKKLVSKKAKVQKVVPVVEEIKEEPIEEVVEESEEDEEVEDAIDEEDVSAEEEEEEEETDVEEETEEEEDDEEKEEPTIPSKVKGGEIPATVPINKIVHVTKLSKKTKQIDIVEAFGKYGAIDQIHLVTTPGGTVANIAFKTEKGAKGALTANKKVKIHEALIWVAVKKEKTEEKKAKTNINETRDRTVYIRYVLNGTTEQQLREHFESCGEIEYVKLVHKFNSTFAFVTFTDKSSMEAALELHNSILNDANIGVFENSDNPTKVEQLYDSKHTVMVKNIQEFKNVDGAKLRAIFSKCGEIESMDVVCKRKVMAFITYKTEEAAQKAVDLSGTTEDGIQLETDLYDPFNKRTTIYISNLPKGCTEEDLTKCFSRAGEISTIILKGTYAIIRFVDTDGYCKSFLYNECFIRKQMIFVEPHSIRKKVVMMSRLNKNFYKKGFKRPAENGNSVFTPKKVKIN